MPKVLKLGFPMVQRQDVRHFVNLWKNRTPLVNTADPTVRISNMLFLPPTVGPKSS